MIYFQCVCPVCGKNAIASMPEEAAAGLCVCGNCQSTITTTDPPEVVTDRMPSAEAYRDRMHLLITFHKELHRNNTDALRKERELKHV